MALTPHVWVIDIDGTLASDDKRIHFVQNPCVVCKPGDLECQDCGGTKIRKNGPDDWKEYLKPERVREDLPIQSAVSAIGRLTRHYVRHGIEKSFKAVFLTGRSDYLELVTKEWVTENIAPHLPSIDYQIWMRVTGDPRTATVMKREKLRELHALYPADLHPHFYYVDDDKHMFNVYAEFPGVFLQAPGCWDHIFPDGTDEHEAPWRR